VRQNVNEVQVLQGDWQFTHVGGVLVVSAYIKSWHWETHCWDVVEMTLRYLFAVDWLHVVQNVADPWQVAQFTSQFWHKNVTLSWYLPSGHCE